MRPELLKLMKCPYCGTDFEIEEVYKPQTYTDIFEDYDENDYY